MRTLGPHLIFVPSSPNSDGFILVHFSFISNAGQQTTSNDAESFQVERLWKQQADERLDVSHLIDRTYHYQSVRELRWHLADRFSSPVRSLRLSRA